MHELQVMHSSAWLIAKNIGRLAQNPENRGTLQATAEAAERRSSSDLMQAAAQLPRVRSFHTALSITSGAF